NVEALTHRSGRTGRAGKKGMNVFIVEEGERRRAERLFSEAKLQLRWTAPPNAAAIAAHDRDRLRRELDPIETPPSAAAQELAAQLLADRDATAILATLIDRQLAERPAGETLTPIDLTPKKHAPAPRRPTDDSFVVFQINLGAKDRAEPN